MSPDDRRAAGRPSPLGRRLWDFLDREGSETAGQDLASTRDPRSLRSPGREGSVGSGRTAGIPPRNVNMWPGHQPAASGSPVLAGDVLRQIRGLRVPPPPTLPAPFSVIVAALHDLAPAVYDRRRGEQYQAVVAVADRYGLNPDTLTKIAGSVGTIVARAQPRPSSRPAPNRGRISLNALAGGDISVATQIHLGRARIRWAASVSEPDRPRLWMVANALTHAVPATTLIAVPATAHGPVGVPPAHRDDLVGWYGIRDAITHLDATVDATAVGHRWIVTASDTTDNRLLALGLLDLTHPAAAGELALHGLEAFRLADIRRLLGHLPRPTNPADLTDDALTAVCDRNGWLLGTPDERRQANAVERLAGSLTDHVTHPLTEGDPAAPPDTPQASTAAGTRSWTDEPQQRDAIQARQLLNETSHQALARFGNLRIYPHLSLDTALLGRFPDRAFPPGLALGWHPLIAEGPHTTNEAPPAGFDQTGNEFGPGPAL